MAGRMISTGWPGVSLGVVAALLAAGCAAASPAPREASAAASSPSASPPTVPAHVTGPPSAAQLKAALLAPTDMGSSFTQEPMQGALGGASGSGSSGSTSVIGCPQLRVPLSAGATTSATDQGIVFQAGQTGPVVAESLITAPAAQLDHAYADDKAALQSCTHLQISSNGTSITLTLSPLTFGGPQSAAVRMDGTVQGVQVNAYLAIDHVGPAELTYFFLQVESGSSQLASYYFRLADAKAQQLIASPA